MSLIITQNYSQTKTTEFSPNNLNVGLRNDGQLFNPNFGGGFSRNDVSGSALRQAGIMIDGIDIGNNLRNSLPNLYDWFQDFKMEPGFRADYVPFYPITEFYEVTKEEILAHQADFIDNGIIDHPIESIFGWPAAGNPFFESMNGFTIPDSEFEESLAPFFKISNLSGYHPELGDFPFVYANFKYPEEEAIPDKIIYFTTTTTYGTSPIFNISYLLYGYQCDENPWTDNTLFLEINMSIVSESDIFCPSVSLFLDSYFGFNGDDQICSIPEWNTLLLFDQEKDSNSANQKSLNSSDYVFVSRMFPLSRNGDKPNNPSYCESYPQNPDTLINAKMDYTTYRLLNSNTPVRNFMNGNDVIYHNIANGLWLDGSPMTSAGTGYNPWSTDTVNYIFEGDIYTKEGWVSEEAEFNPYIPKIVSQTTDLAPFQPNSNIRIMYIFSLFEHSDSNSIYSQLENFNNHLNDFFFSPFDELPGDVCSPFSEESSVQDGSIENENFAIQPNPVIDILEVTSNINGKLRIFNPYGQLVSEISCRAGESLSMDFSAFPKGMYFLNFLTKNHKTTTKKVLKI